MKATNMASPVNKDVIQSYLVTSARYDFNVQEKRILFRLVEMCQNQLEGKKLNPGYHFDKNLIGDYEVIVPISAFLTRIEVEEEKGILKNKNYSRVKEALRRLRNKTIEIEEPDPNYPGEYIWKLIGIIEKPKFETRGYAKFEIQPEIFEAILNFAKGYRRIELKTAFEFESVYAMRMYELLSGKKDPITYTIEQLKKMFKIEKKYKYTTDFILYVIEPAKKELDKKSPYSFNYTKNKQGKKVVSLTFEPYVIPGNVDQELEKQRLEKQVSIWWDIDKKVGDYLTNNYGFSTKEMSNNKELIIEAQKKMDIMLFLSKKKRKANDAKNPKGYIISALKKELQTITHA
jgi:plasmid replication initiation protein